MVVSYEEIFVIHDFALFPHNFALLFNALEFVLMNSHQF